MPLLNRLMRQLLHASDAGFGGIKVLGVKGAITKAKLCHLQGWKICAAVYPALIIIDSPNNIRFRRTGVLIFCNYILIVVVPDQFKAFG